LNLILSNLIVKLRETQLKWSNFFANHFTKTRGLE